MSITPAPPHVLNYTLFQDQQRSIQAQQTANMEKSSARRKQSFPTKASVQAEAIPMDQEKEEEDYIPDFTGNNPWCNLVKGKVGLKKNIYVFIILINFVCDFRVDRAWRGGWTFPVRTAVRRPPRYGDET